MATAPRKSTGRAASAKTGAASAVAKDKDLTVQSETPLAVEPDTDLPSMERAEAEADAEDARQQAQAKSDAGEGDTTPEGEPAKITEGVYGPAGTKEEPVVHVKAETAASGASLAEVDEEQAPKRDLDALRAIADTSGRDPVTPYTAENVPAPAPRVVLPPLRNSHDWTGDGDTGATARVLVDGFRVQINGAYRFALRGDRITAPTDVIERGVSRKVLHQED